MRHIVVLFGSDQTHNDFKSCDLSHCPMEAHSFQERWEAEAFAAGQPEWTHPHLLRDQEPS